MFRRQLWVLTSSIFLIASGEEIELFLGPLRAIPWTKNTKIECWHQLRLDLAEVVEEADRDVHMVVEKVFERVEQGRSRSEAETAALFDEGHR